MTQKIIVFIQQQSLNKREREQKNGIFCGRVSKFRFHTVGLIRLIYGVLFSIRIMIIIVIIIFV